MITIELTDNECRLLCAALVEHRVTLQTAASRMHYDAATFEAVHAAAARAADLQRKLETGSRKRTP